MNFADTMVVPLSNVTQINDRKLCNEGYEALVIIWPLAFVSVAIISKAHLNMQRTYLLKHMVQ